MNELLLALAGVIRQNDPKEVFAFAKDLVAIVKDHPELVNAIVNNLLK